MSLCNNEIYRGSESSLKQNLPFERLWFVVCKGWEKNEMRTLIAILLWCILLIMCWPLALILIFLLPIIWLILLPFKIVGFTLEVVFKLISGILLFPFRIAGVVK